MESNTNVVGNQNMNFANFSVEKRKSDPFTVVDGRYIGHDGFVVPRDFGEFYERFPEHVRKWVARHVDRSTPKQDIEDWTQDLLIRLDCLPANSKHRTAGKQDVVQTFDPHKQYGASSARFFNYLNLCLGNRFASMRSARMQNPLCRPGNLSLTDELEGTDHDEFCHRHSEHLRRRCQRQERQRDTKHALLEFSEFVQREDSTVLPAMDAIQSNKVHADADDNHDSDENLVEIGLRIAPPFINTAGKDLKLVGLGSFIVNAQADCNGCHGSDPAKEFLPTNNPYFLPPNNFPVKYNQATYLNGGQNFGPVGPGVVKDSKSPLFAGPGLGPNIITRNLTPDFTGNPEGGNDLSTFMTILRTGHDFDRLHPNCGGSVTDNCYNAPVNGAVLQVMPWPKYQNMTDHQLKAIWTYLSTVPCFAHDDALGNAFPWLKNVCSH